MHDSENNFKSDSFENSILVFSKVDYKNYFSFASGHLGTLPIDESILKNILFDTRLSWSVKRFFILAFEIIKFSLILLVPIKNIGILFRTALRKLFKPNQKFSSHDLAFISLGDGGVDEDAYFRPLLTALDHEYCYIKIVGGKGYSPKNYVYIESFLTRYDLFKFSFYLIFNHFILLPYLSRGVLKIEASKLKIAYLILALMEINRGIVVQNQIICKSIKSLLNNQRCSFKKVVYPMEGRSWEKNIVKLFNAYSLTSIGYIHCMLTPRHFSLVNVGFYEKNEIPSLILAPSEMIFTLVKRVFKDALIKRGFFLRGSGPLLNENLVISPNKILFALTGDERQSKKIMDYIQSSKILRRYNVIVRLNKNTSTYASLCEYARALGLVLCSDSNSNIDLPAVCFFRSSSVALDYLRHNTMPIYLKFDDEVSGNIFDFNRKNDCPNVTIGQSFESDIEIALSNSDLFNKSVNGQVISNYYLDQQFCMADLIGMIK